MFRIIRVPVVLDKFFGPLRPHFHWNHWMYFRLLVLAMACMWGRRNVTNLYRYLEVEHHRTRFNNFFLPVGVKVVVVFDAYYLCLTVVEACRSQHFHYGLSRNARG